MIMHPWKIYAEYADGFSKTFEGNDEDDCMWKVGKAVEEHGECTFYTGVSDEDYVDGEYIGRENFIYE